MTLAALAISGLASAADAGCLASKPAVCSRTINRSGKVGRTDYVSLPFASNVYGQSWASSPGLSPENLFWQQGTNFTNSSTMAAAQLSATTMTAAGVVPASGSQRWEDTYEASQPAALFPGEPSWVAADRQDLNLLNLPDYQAWVSWQKAHANLFIAGADGGSEGVDLRPWGGDWGHISPMMPLPAKDWPAGMSNVTYGDWYAYRWGQTAKLSGAYGIMLSDFSDSQPTSPSWMQGFNREIIAAFQTSVGQTIPGGTIPQQASYINANLVPEWNDFLSEGYANFYQALALQLQDNTGQPSLVIDQCGLWPSARRFYGTDEQIVAKLMPNRNYTCIWDDQTMQVGRSGESMIWGIGGMVIAAAREPNIRNGGNLSADDPAYWQAVASFWSGLSAADQNERGLKELKRAWLETAWSHIATRSGTTRRALAFMSRDYWDAGQIDPVVQQLIQTISPTRPFGFALYYSKNVERSVEATIPSTGDMNATYMNPDLLLDFKNGGGAVGYYVAAPGLADLQNSARPAAWVVLGGTPPAAELQRLKAVAPVLTSLSAALSYANAPLAFSAGLTGMGFYDQNNRLILTVSAPGSSAVTGTVTLKTLPLPSGQYVATDLFSNAKIGFTVAGGKAVMPLTVSRWDTRAFAISRS